MAQKRGKNKGAAPASSKGGSKGRNNKQPTQKPKMERIAIMGPTGKVRFEWRPWAK